MTVLQRIEALLAEQAVPHRRLEHAAVFTSQEAADIRGEPIDIGGKALVMKLGDEEAFAVFVLSARLRTHGVAIRRHLGLRRLRFATREELLDLTGLTPGCVPPFGPPIFPHLPLYVDESIARNPRIAFNAGDHGVSVIMQVADYLPLAAPTAIFDFSRE